MELVSDSSKKPDEALDSDFEFDIQKTIENRLERTSLDASDIEPRLDYLVSQLSTISDESQSLVSTSEPEIRILKFLINQEHNVKVCPECGAGLLKSDAYCYKCGLKLSIDSTEELSDLEKLYDKKISHKTDNAFKFAYVIYLDRLMKNQPVSQKKIQSYNATLDKLRKKALEDGYDNPDNALSFIEKNRHVLFYDSHPDLKTVINIDLYEDIFEDKSSLTVSQIVETIIGYLNKQYFITLSNYEISRYYNVLSILSKCHEYLGDIDLTLRINFKLFI